MEEETIAEYNVRVLEIANESFNLGEKIRMVPIIEITTIFEEEILKTRTGEKVEPLNVENLVVLATIKQNVLIYEKTEKKSLSVTLFDEDIDESEEEDEFTNMFIDKMANDDSITDNEKMLTKKENLPSYNQLQLKWEEDSAARAVKKETIQELLEENHLLFVITSLKQRFNEVQTEYDQMMKSVKMLNS